MIGLVLLDPHRPTIMRTALLTPSARYLSTELPNASGVTLDSFAVALTIIIEDRASALLAQIARSVAGLEAAVHASRELIATTNARTIEDAANRANAERTPHP